MLKIIVETSDTKIPLISSKIKPYEAYKKCHDLSIFYVVTKY